MKRLTIGSLVGLVALYILGIVIWEMIFSDFFAANAGSAMDVNREAPIVWAVAVGSLFYAVLLTLAIESRTGDVSIVDGMMVGAVIGFLLWGTADMILFANQNVNNLTGAIADTVLEAVRGGICGAIIAVVLSKVGN
jgi:predicted DNA repair protein MutK